MSLPIMDFVFIVIVLALGILGVVKGFFNGVFSLAAPVLGLWLASVFCEKLSAPIETYVKITWLSVILAFLLIFIVVFLIVKIVEKILKGIFSGMIFKSLDRVLGLIFGLLEGIALVTVILFALKIQPWFECDGLLQGSIFYKMLSPLISSHLSSVSSAVEKATNAGVDAAEAASKAVQNMGK